MTISFVFLTVSKTMYLNRTYIISCVQDITKIFFNVYFWGDFKFCQGKWQCKCRFCTIKRVPLFYIDIIIVKINVMTFLIFIYWYIQADRKCPRIKQDLLNYTGKLFTVNIHFILFVGNVTLTSFVKVVHYTSK